MLQISERFAAQCAPVIGVQNDTCGSITRASIAHLTPSQLNSIFTPGGLFADLDAWFLHQIEMKACGVKRNAFYDWIMANADREMFRAAVSGIKAVKGPSLLHPFIFGRQMTVVNRDYWKVVNGIATGGYTINTPATAKGTMSAGPLTTVTGGTRVIRVDNRHNIPMDPNWFRQREVLHIFNRAGNGVVLHGAWRVVSAAVDTALTYVDVLLASENAGSITNFDAAPTTGVLLVGINNVNDFEKWCQNLPNIDPRKRVPFWWQTSRQARCVDSEYKVVYKRLFDANPAFREFGDLPLAERNAQDEMEAQHRFVVAFLFQKAISANQTLANWESLEAINTIAGSVLDTGMSGKLIARRANFIGVKEQLRLCDRVIDVQNNKLNLMEFLDLNYDIMRARKTGNRRVTDIDWFTNSTFRAHFQTAMMTYYKEQYLDQLRITVEVGKLTELGMVYDSYLVKRPGGIRINIISDEFFDDLYSEFDAAGIGSAANLLLALDIGKPPVGSIYWAQIASNRKAYTTAQIDQLAKFDQTYRCVMDALTIDQTLTSEAGTVVVECPLFSAWIEGFQMAVPVTTGQTGPNYTNLY